MDSLIRAVRNTTEPSPSQVERLVSRLVQRPDADVAGLVRGVGAPSDDAVDALVARLAVRPQRAERSRRWPWAASALLVAAAALLIVAAPRGPAVQPLDLALRGVETVEVHPVDAVDLSLVGTGHLGGTTASPRLTWTQGQLDVSVDPGAKLDLEVETPEAVVRVIGTVFSVLRDATGTQVTVTRGTVEVVCVGSAPTRITGGEQHACWPTGLAGLLQRLQALETRGAAGADVLATVDRLLTIDPPAAVEGELLATRVRTLLTLDRPDDAAHTARRYLDRGHTPRQAELQALLHELSRNPALGGAP